MPAEDAIEPDQPTHDSEPQPIDPADLSVQLAPGARLKITFEALDGQSEVGSQGPLAERRLLQAGDSYTVVAHSPPPPEPEPDSPEPEADPGPLLSLTIPTFQPAQYLTEIRARLSRLTPPEVLFALALLIYFSVRLIGLSDYPIFFFSDEAVQTQLAADFMRDNFRNEQDTLLPTYFKNGYNFNLSLSVYAQAIPYILFGKSVFVTRAVSVLISGLAAVAVSLTLRNIFKLPYWWAAGLLLSMAPAWFLHSRTAFETVIAAACFAAFIYYYLLYRTQEPRKLYTALVFGALTFYAYSPAQVLIGLTGLLLLIADLKYHWRHREIGFRGLGLLLLLALPYVRFQAVQPGAAGDHLRDLGSYWLEPIPLAEKFERFWAEYLYGLSPGYWYFPNETDLPRHRSPFGHLTRLTLPLALAGLLIALRNFRKPAYRTVLLALLAVPVGAALVRIGITRTLAFTIPAILLTTLALAKGLVWIESRGLPRRVLGVGLFAILAVANFGLLRESLLNGPHWTLDYGLGGMQYGARQIFAEIDVLLEDDPGVQIIFSPNWANGTTELARFFLNDPLPIQLGSIDAWMNDHRPINTNTLFIMTIQEYQQMQESGKFVVQAEQVGMLYPDGSPGFYFVRLDYVADIIQILAEEREARKILQASQVLMDGEQVGLSYSLMDMGQPADLVDGDQNTLMRTMEANPAIFEFAFPTQRSFRGIDITIGSAMVEVTVLIYLNDGSPLEFKSFYQGRIDAPQLHIGFGDAVTADFVRVEVLQLEAPEPAHVHVWELTFLEE
jgi:hypothetical protein